MRYQYTYIKLTKVKILPMQSPGKNKKQSELSSIAAGKHEMTQLFGEMYVSHVTQKFHSYALQKIN